MMWSRIVLVVGLAVLIAPARANHPTDLDGLLEQVRQANTEDARVRARREAQFLAENSDRRQLLDDMRNSVAAEKARSEALKAQFESNESDLRGLNAQLSQNVGVLGELFGTVRQVANDLNVLLSESLVSSQYPGRAEWFDVLATARSLPDLSELERFWLLLQHEIEQSGQVVSFPANIILADGRAAQARVTRVGTFVAVANGHYLMRLPDSVQLAELSRQPSSEFLALAGALERARQGYVPMVIDPTRGSLLGVLVQAPNLEERLRQGGLIGYIILTLGATGLLLAGYRLVYLLITGRRMRQQLASLSQPGDDNPLGRVLLSARDAEMEDTAAIELCLDEAILRETPRLTRGHSVIKLLAAVAPLLGLLGTVTGMILTFQSISLFGTGDPKLMAGGISQALVTTVLGLVVAIPLLFSHNLITARSRELVQMLDEQSAGLLARGHKDG